MPQPAPLLTINDTVLWLKVVLTLATLVLLYLRYRKGTASGAPAPAYSFRAKVVVALVVLFSLAVFHNLGATRGGTFVHYGEMFHYYLGSKYFEELGYYELYNAVIVADAEQGNSLAGLPFYTDLHTYKNAPREAAAGDHERIRGLFSEERWGAFKGDVAFFKMATAKPHAPGLFFQLMDHGYNASPVATSILGVLTNAVPVHQVHLLALLDVFLVAAMIALVFHAFGLEMGGLFSVYFSVNILNDHSYISGSLLRYDWLFYIVAAVCLLEKKRYAPSAVFLTLAAMLRVFPAMLFYGVAVTILQRTKTTRAVDKNSMRFILAAAATGLALFLLPAASLGSVLQPWKDFAANTALHNDGVYVNHLGLRGIALFEPSHLSLEKFAETYRSDHSPDIVRNWQDAKEREFERKRPVIVLASLFVLFCVTAILWKRRAGASESVFWSLPLVYAMSFASHYYYAFLCLFVLLFFRRSNTLHAFVPLCLLLILNVCALVTDSFGPSPIVFYTLANIYIFVCFAAILGFELYTSVLGKGPSAIARVQPPHESRRDAKRRRRQERAQRR